MQLKIIGSNSQGNAYLLENSTEALLLECGVNFELIKRAVDFNIRKIQGCLLSHEHKDHSKYVEKVMQAGINVYASFGTHQAMKTEGHHRSRFLHPDDMAKIGSFRVRSFPVQHDAVEPLGFLIFHMETGVVLFLTDSYFSEYKFEGLNNIIIEANYSQDILDQRRNQGDTVGSLRDRIVESHMSLATCKELLQANDLSQVTNIVLIHLSDSNSDADRFKREVREATGKMVWIANAGMVIPFTKTPF